MSMSYWPIVGYGVNLDELYKYINKDKVKKLLQDMNPNEKFGEDVFDDDTFYGEFYDSFAEFLVELDGTRRFSYDDDGAGVKYFFYPPVYPWLMSEDKRMSSEECENEMIKILKQVYDISDEELINHIGYIDTVGMA